QLRRALVMVHDLVVTAIAWVFAFYLRYDFAPPESVRAMLLWSTPAAMAVFGASYQWSQMYVGIWRYASVPDLVRIGRAVGLGTVLLLALLFITVRAGDLPRGVMVILPLLLMSFLSGPRLLNRLFKMRHEFMPRADDGGRRRILLVGAGDAAELLLRDAMRPDARFTVVGLVDDDLKKQGLRIHGVPVHGPIATLAGTIDHLTAIQRRPDELVIAIPSASREQMRRIVDCCERSGLPFRATPALDDIVTGRVQIGELREVTIEDLLSRATVRLDESAVRTMITGKTVLVTGAGGSIGSELCRQIARFGPAKLVLFEVTEFNLYEIDRELGRVFPSVARAAVLGDVRDEVRVKAVLAEHRPDTVLHAAAYKHVPLVEQNATEGVLNNLLGTRTIARACAKQGVGRFVLVSTDKAVNPVNVMG
ncbi:MAG: polysaccharide biosynthesis protein, partial [Myxococcales bacterium]|nr:polysaccharide biosynthesis protein [Myxococcales bacterium]